MTAFQQDAIALGGNKNMYAKNERKKKKNVRGEKQNDVKEKVVACSV